jgi:hypothetical protein
MRDERLPRGMAIEEVLSAEHRGSFELLVLSSELRGEKLGEESFELEVEKGEVVSSE